MRGRGWVAGYTMIGQGCQVMLYLPPRIPHASDKTRRRDYPGQKKSAKVSGIIIKLSIILLMLSYFDEFGRPQTVNGTPARLESLPFTLPATPSAAPVQSQSLEPEPAPGRLASLAPKGARLRLAPLKTQC